MDSPKKIKALANKFCDVELFCLSSITRGKGVVFTSLSNKKSQFTLVKEEEKLAYNNKLISKFFVSYKERKEPLDKKKAESFFKLKQDDIGVILVAFNQNDLSFILAPYRLPKDTYLAVWREQFSGNTSNEFKTILDVCGNLYYFLQKLTYFEYDTPFIGIGNAQRKELFNKNTLNFKFDKRLIDYAANTAKNIVETLYPESNRRILEPSSSWRTIIGLGGESVYEVSMTLHHVYGIPYIPASSIKGLLRNYLIATCFNKSEENAEKSKLMSVIFGSTDNQGKAVFFDAFPKTNPTIEADIMNVHYSSYYGGNDAPTDTSNPIPVQFLTVGKGTKFEIHIAYNSKDIKCADLFADEEKKELDIFKKIWERNPAGESITILDFVQLALDKALSEHGIGAKTAVGYGYMQ